MTTTCVIEGCEREHYAKGWCNMHWQRWRKHGDPHYVFIRKLATCSVEECNRDAIARRLCTLHYQRWQQSGDPLTVTWVVGGTFIDRLKEHVKHPLNDDECWEWETSHDKDKYAFTTIDHRLVRAHRASLEYFKGPIPSGLLVLHSCDNPPCVNPRHLRVGTQKENAQDREERTYGRTKKEPNT